MAGLPRSRRASSFHVGLGERLPFVPRLLDGGVGTKVDLCAMEVDTFPVDPDMMLLFSDMSISECESWKAINFKWCVA
jgi:hypothetical protein